MISNWYNIKAKYLLTYSLAFFIILSHSIYAYINLRIVVNSIYVILSFIPVLYFFIRGKGKLLKIGYCKWYALLYFVLLAVFIKCVSPADYISYSCRYLIFVPFMILVFIDLNDTGNIMSIFFAISDIIYIISCIALFFWLFGTTLHIIPPSGTIYAVWGNAVRNLYYGVYLEVPGRWLSFSIQRNVGIFCEAPAFAFFLGIAFGTEFLLRSPRKNRLFILFLTLISTGTSTALLVILFCFIARYWLNSEKKTINNLLFRVFLIIGAIFACSKGLRFILAESKMASVSLRINDYLNGFNAWRASPFWGYGYMLNSAESFSSGYSNSITQIVLGCGVALFSLYVVSFALMFFLNEDKHFKIWLILIVFLFSISVVGYAYISLTNLSLGYAILFCRRKKNGALYHLRYNT